MNPYGVILCPTCKKDMSQRVGRSWNNRIYFFCECGEKLNV